MATEKRLIDANALILDLKDELEYETPMFSAEQNKWIDYGLIVAIKDVKYQPTVDAVEVDKIKLHHIIIDNEGVPEVKLQIGDRYFILRSDPVDVREVVHSRFVNVADFGDGEGCFGYCERCGTVHHAQSPVALKADYRWCRWCGAKMDGDGNDI
jgi:hypothetical protein